MNEMEEEDGLVTNLRAMLAEELALDPEPRAGSTAATRVERLRVLIIYGQPKLVNDLL